jgi:hypothetical protein
VKIFSHAIDLGFVQICNVQYTSTSNISWKSNTFKHGTKTYQTWRINKIHDIKGRNSTKISTTLEPELDANTHQKPAPRRPVGKAGAPESRPKPRMAKTLPKPQNLAGMANPTPLDDPMYKESIFGTDISVRENDMRTTVQPAVFGLIPTTEAVWQEIVASNSNTHKEMIVEGLRYYATGLLWLRIIQLKKSNKQPLTEAETMISGLCDTTVFAVPSPLQIYLQSLGTVRCTGTGQTLIPEFPPLPDEVIAEFSGYFGEMGEDTHNLYEEFPCLGVAGETLRHALSNEAAGEYASSLAFDGLAVNRNLQGYAPLANRRNEAKNPFLNLGDTSTVFLESVQSTGFNYDVMFLILTWMAKTKAFKNEAVLYDHHRGAPDRRSRRSNTKRDGRHHCNEPNA